MPVSARRLWPLFLLLPAWVLLGDNGPTDSGEGLPGCVRSNGEATAPVISEFMLVNKTTLATTVEGRTVYPDWIEIHNPSDEPIDLAGWYLTDTLDERTRWPLPAIELKVDGILLIFASGIQEADHPENWPYQDNARYYHTNFKLSRDDDCLALVGPDLEVVHAYGSATGDAAGLPALEVDQSYGWYDGGLQYFIEPSPGRANAAGYARICEPPVSSHPAGTFTEPFLLTLSSPDQDAVIRYTTNGDVPDATSRIYTEPLSIATTTEVVARAYASDKAPSAPVGCTYLALADDLADFRSNLPVVLIDTVGAGLDSDVRTRVQAAFIEPDNDGYADILDPANFIGRGGLEIRGSTTLGYPKNQYDFEVWDVYDRDREVSLLGLPTESDWILYAPGRYDRALINNALVYELSNQMGRYAARTRFCEVYLNFDGGRVDANDYVGLYIFMEKIEPGENRVDIEELDPWDSAEPAIAGGYMLKIDRADPNDVGFHTSRGNPSQDGKRLCYVSPKEADVTDAQAAWLLGYLDAFEDALYGPNAVDPQLGYAQYIDVDSWVDHNLLNMLAKNLDALRLSTFITKTRHGKLAMGPVWDFDRALDSADGRDDNPENWDGARDATSYHTCQWWDRLFVDVNFWQRYIDRWYALRDGGAFSTAGLNATIDAMAVEITEAADRDAQRWDHYDWRYGGFQGEIDHLKEWLEARCLWVDRQFVAPPELSCDSGGAGGIVVSLLDPNESGTIYYSLDGSDPRLPVYGEDASTGASIAEAAQEYTEPLILTESVHLKARVLVDDNAYSPWSGLADTVIAVGSVAESLRISEIMYHPMDTSSVDDSRTEYVELINIGDATIDLNLVAFTDGIGFVFPQMELAPQAYVLVVRDREAFTAKYGDGFPIAGQYDGALANGGEHVELQDAAGQTILSFDYSDDWYDLTDGKGLSLTVIDPAGIDDPNVLNAPSVWQPSTEIDGTPGFADPGQG